MAYGSAQYWLSVYNGYNDSMQKLVAERKTVQEYKSKVVTLLNPVEDTIRPLEETSNAISEGVIINNKPYDEDEIKEDIVKLKEFHGNLNALIKYADKAIDEIDVEYESYKQPRNTAYNNYRNCLNNEDND